MSERPDRITWDDDDKFDEIVVSDALVRIERLDARLWNISITRGKEVLVLLDVTAPRLDVCTGVPEG